MEDRWILKEVEIKQEYIDFAKYFWKFENMEY
jgi:hypothetical protein